MPLSKMKTQSWGQATAFRYPVDLSVPDDFQQVKDRKDRYWEPERQEALKDYRSNRENGSSADNPSRAFPRDGADTFEKGRGKDKDGYARNPKWWYVTYTEGPGDKQWMEEKDRNYLARLKREKEAEKQARLAAEEKLTASVASSASTGSNASAGPSTPISDTGEVTLSFHIDPNELQRHENLGEGSYSVVYRATYRFQDVAVKELKSVNLSEKALVELKNEVNIMARLHSKHIVHFHGACFDPPYRLVMEYMPKGSLYNVLKSKEPLSWHQRYRIGLDVTIGLFQMHQQKPPMLHRDVKSLNVLLDTQYRAKLTDFGLSKIKTETASTTRHMGSVGSLPWMAPELFGLRPKYSPASDVYALGMVLWELASRQLPYSEVADPSEIRFAVKDGEREEVPYDCPMAFGKLIESCWAQKPEKRPTAKVVAESLSKLFNASPLSKQPDNTTYMHSENPGEETVLSFGASS